MFSIGFLLWQSDKCLQRKKYKLIIDIQKTKFNSLGRLQGDIYKAHASAFAALRHFTAELFLVERLELGSVHRLDALERGLKTLDVAPLNQVAAGDKKFAACLANGQNPISQFRFFVPATGRFAFSGIANDVLNLLDENGKNAACGSGVGIVKSEFSLDGVPDTGEDIFGHEPAVTKNNSLFTQAVAQTVHGVGKHWHLLPQGFKDFDRSLWTHGNLISSSRP
ncbi:MAG: hypothetical protein HN403_18005 [Rhodospirillales bacterium]|nr:hypothetical protein [Rhodospirillales bacterium]